MRLWLTRAQAQAIADDALRAAPHETCGLIGGRGAQASLVIPIPNIADNPETAYHLDPQAQVAAMLTLQRQNLDLIAIYHSHPASRPLPSQTDIRQAAYPDAAYLIVGLAETAPRFAAWRIRHSEVTPVDLVISDTPPPPTDDPTLTTGQKTAIIVSVLLATALLIAYSILLLPPPPPIPTPGG